MKVPKVSIVLTSYNHEKYIGDSINSVLNQTYEDYELIIADDCSEDNSWDIITAFKDPRIKAYRSDRNERVLINKVLSNGMATGDFVAIHHSDDLWESTKLEKQVKFLDNNQDIGAVFSRAKIVDSIGNILKFTDGQNPTIDTYLKIFCQGNRSREEWLAHFFYYGNCLCHPSLLIRSNCYRDIGLYNLFYRQLPDLDYWIRLCRKYEIHILEEELVRFRIIENNGNTSSLTPETRRRGSYEFLQILKNYEDISDAEEIQKIFPQARKYNGTINSNSGYLLSRVAFDSHSLEANLFGMQLLGEKMRSQDFRESCETLHGFTLDDYHALIGSVDLFKTERISMLETEVSMLERKIIEHNRSAEAQGNVINALSEKNNLLLVKISDMTQSKSWKITAPLRKLDNSIKNKLKSKLNSPKKQSTLY